MVRVIAPFRHSCTILKFSKTTYLTARSFFPLFSKMFPHFSLCRLTENFPSRTKCLIGENRDEVTYYWTWQERVISLDRPNSQFWWLPLIEADEKRATVQLNNQALYGLNVFGLKNLCGNRNWIRCQTKLIGGIYSTFWKILVIIFSVSFHWRRWFLFFHQAQNCFATKRNF